MAQSKKHHYNEIYKEIAFSGPILCRLKHPYTFILRNEIWTWFPQGSFMILLSGPATSGKHKEAGINWIILSPMGICVSTHMGFFDDLFCRI